MTFDAARWQRLEFEKTPVYVGKDSAGWFVPNQAGDAVLKEYNSPILNGGIDIRRFIERLPDSPSFDYRGRANVLLMGGLKELWFHITNRCNLACSHCLFASSCNEKDELPVERLLEIADEAEELGCRLFALTGGEPFVHRNFKEIVHHLLKIENSHVVVLTNGMGIVKQFNKNQWDVERFHLQISVDGLRENHDRIRGRGTFDQLSKTLTALGKDEIPYTLSMCVNRLNVRDMPGMVDLAADLGAKNVHYMWYFVRGRGDAGQFVSPDEIFEGLKAAADRALERDVSIDNIEALKTQVFAPPGTVHDGTTACWESLAVGPDGRLYPSAALVGTPDLAVGLEDGLEVAWKKSPVMETFRKASVADLSHHTRYLLGGGDSDHSYSHKTTVMGDDPYLPLYEKMALWLIAREALKQRETPFPELKLKMGDILESCGAHGSIALVHSNCLLSVAHKNSLSVVKEFYSAAVGDTKEDILNPVCYADELIGHIPEKFRFRGYGCGSPVVDANLGSGEQVVDLGCGGGVECFIASKLVGKTGSVVGIDMLDPMLALADKGLKGVLKNLGYGNVEFKKGYLEDLPLEDNWADVVLSNCVMNLSVNKRKSYSEIFRILKPGGRLMISDVVCDLEPDPAIRNDEVLRGECIAGAMTQKDLMGILSESGFESIRLAKRFPYRTIAGHPFFSLTYEAYKPVTEETVSVMYRGPLKAGIFYDGRMLLPGIKYNILKTQADLLGDTVFVLDDEGAVTNLAMENSCSCAMPPEAAVGCCAPVEVKPMLQTMPRLHSDVIEEKQEKMTAGCMKCGAPLIYTAGDRIYACTYCKKESATHAVCENGHFVCDACHSKEGLPVIEHICLATKETDMIFLFEEIRKHPAIPVNGPEHHIMVPGIILATYGNLGGKISADDIRKGIKRGAQVPGGYCGFMGICGAAVGVGIAFALILESNPVKPVERKIVQGVTGEVLMDIAAHEAARCCQRDSWIALKKAAELSVEYLPIPLKAQKLLSCRQQGKNKECIKGACPLWPGKKC